MNTLLTAIALLMAVGTASDAGTRYLASIYQKLSKTKPAGNVTVSFDIESSGHVSALRVAKSSGDPTIDTSVLRAVLSASPFDPLPEIKRERRSGADRC